MSAGGRVALVAGATGLVGSRVVARLVARPEYARVTLLVRRATHASGRADAKLDERVVDFERLDDAQDAMKADDVYACLGTTIKAAGSQERFRRVDHDYTVEVARRARAAGATRLALVSSIGASAESGTFYLRVKGETERDVEALGYPTLTIARPSLLAGERAERRRGEGVGLAVSRALSFAMVGGLRAYRSIDADAVAGALVHATLAGEPGVRRLTYDELMRASAT